MCWYEDTLLTIAVTLFSLFELLCNRPFKCLAGFLSNFLRLEFVMIFFMVMLGKGMFFMLIRLEKRIVICKLAGMILFSWVGHPDLSCTLVLENYMCRSLTFSGIPADLLILNVFNDHSYRFCPQLWNRYIVEQLLW